MGGSCSIDTEGIPKSVFLFEAYPGVVEPRDGSSSWSVCGQPRLPPSRIQLVREGDADLFSKLETFHSPSASIHILSVLLVVSILRAVGGEAFAIALACVVGVSLLFHVAMMALRGQLCAHRMSWWTAAERWFSSASLLAIAGLGVAAFAKQRISELRIFPESAYEIDGVLILLQLAHSTGVSFSILQFAATSILILVLLTSIDFTAPALSRERLSFVIRILFHIGVAVLSSFIRRTIHHLRRIELTTFASLLSAANSFADYQKEIDVNATVLASESLVEKLALEGLPAQRDIQDATFFGVSPHQREWMNWQTRYGPRAAFDLMRNVTDRLLQLCLSPSCPAPTPSGRGILKSDARPPTLGPAMKFFIGDTAWVFLSPNQQRPTSTDCCLDLMVLATNLRDFIANLDFAPGVECPNFGFLICKEPCQVTFVGNAGVSTMLGPLRGLREVLGHWCRGEIVVTDEARALLQTYCSFAPFCAPGNTENPLPVPLSTFRGWVGPKFAVSPRKRRTKRGSITFAGAESIGSGEDASGAERTPVTTQVSFGASTSMAEVEEPNPLTGNLRLSRCILEVDRRHHSSQLQVLKSIQLFDGESPANSSISTIPGALGSAFDLEGLDEWLEGDGEGAEAEASRSATQDGGFLGAVVVRRAVLGSIFWFQPSIETVYQKFIAQHHKRTRFPAHVGLFTFCIAMAALVVMNSVTSPDHVLEIPWFIVQLVCCVLNLTVLILHSVNVQIRSIYFSLILYFSCCWTILALGPLNVPFTRNSSAALRIALGIGALFATLGQQSFVVQILLDVVFVLTPSIIKHGVWSTVGRGCVSPSCEGVADLVLLIMSSPLIWWAVISEALYARHQFLNSLNCARVTKKLGLLRGAYFRLLKRFLPAHFAQLVFEGCRCCGIPFCQGQDIPDAAVLAIEICLPPRLFTFQALGLLHQFHCYLETLADAQGCSKEFVQGDLTVFLHLGRQWISGGSEAHRPDRRPKRDGALALLAATVAGLEQHLSDLKSLLPDPNNDMRLGKPLAAGISRGAVCIGFIGSNDSTQRPYITGPTVLEAIGFAQGWAGNVPTVAVVMHERTFHTYFPPQSWAAPGVVVLSWIPSNTLSNTVSPSQAGQAHASLRGEFFKAAAVWKPPKLETRDGVQETSVNSFHTSFQSGNGSGSGPPPVVEVVWIQFRTTEAFSTSEGVGSRTTDDPSPPSEDPQALPHPRIEERLKE